MRSKQLRQCESDLSTEICRLVGAIQPIHQPLIPAVPAQNRAEQSSNRSTAALRPRRFYIYISAEHLLLLIAPANRYPTPDPAVLYGHMGGVSLWAAR